MSHEPHDIGPAADLAKALDNEDYDAARALMRDDCSYEIRGEVIEGADAIIASCRGKGENARDRFDSIRYGSEVHPVEAGLARIEYTDYAEHDGDRLVHRCAQEIELDTEGAVMSIRHIDYPGEREAVEAFFKRHT